MLKNLRELLLKLLGVKEERTIGESDFQTKIRELEQKASELEKKNTELESEQRKAKETVQHQKKDKVSKAPDVQKTQEYDFSNLKERATEEAKKIIFEAKEEALKIKEKADEYQEKVLAKQEEIDNSFKKISNEKDKIEGIKEDLEAKKRRLEELEAEREKKILELSSLTKQEATSLLLNDLDKKLVGQYAQKIKLYEEKFLAESEQKAKETLLDAMHHASTDYVAEFTVSTVKFDDHQVKGKIIGKEGRNIKTFEELTGVDLDLESEENEARLSSFDPIRREIAKLSLEKLIKDGRIHPARIEEIVNKTTKEMEKMIYAAGEDLCNRLKVYNLPRDLILKLGQFKFRTSYGQNMIKHTLEETQMGVKLAKELGVDIVATKLACLLHDIGKVITDKEGNHMDLGADYIKKLGMPEVVVNAVRESHDDKPSNMVGVIVQIVDSISGARPGARYEDYENFVERMQKLEDVSMQFEGVHKAYAISAGREVRVIVEPEKIDDAKVEKLSNDIAQKIAQIQDFPGIVKVTVIREKRAFAYTTG